MRRRPPSRSFGGDERSLELADRMRELVRSISSLQRELLADVAEFDRAEAWRGDGAISMRAWLTERCGVSSGTAGAWTQTAARLESLPHLTDALAEGSLSFDALAPLAEVATAATDAQLAAKAVHWSVKQIRELVASHKDTTDAAAARDFAHRTLRLNDAKGAIWISLPKDDYAWVKASLIAEVRGRDDWDSGGSNVAGPSGDPRDAAQSGARSDPLGYVPFDQRLCDVFVDLFRTGNATSHPQPGRDADRRVGLRPTMVVHVDFGWLSGSSEKGIGQIPGTGSVSRQVARRLACDANIVFSLDGHDGSILDQKRLRRSPTRAQRMEIARRDGGCRFPSCSFVDFTEVHHIRPWEKGGETNQSNLLTLCDRHHRAVHELGWSVEGDAEGLMTFTGPHGRAMTSMPSPTWRAHPMRR